MNEQEKHTLIEAGRQDLVDAWVANEAASAALHKDRERLKRKVQTVLDAAKLAAHHDQLRRSGHAPTAPDLLVWVKPTDDPKYADVYDFRRGAYEYKRNRGYTVRTADGVEKGKAATKSTPFAVEPGALRAALDSLKVPT